MVVADYASNGSGLGPAGGAASGVATSSETIEIPNTGASGGTLVVTAIGGCTWAAASNTSWIAITSGAAGVGDGSVTYSVAANFGAPRAGTLTVAGQTVTVTQGNTYSNAAPIAIPGSGSASPYPSSVAVSGLTGLVGSVSVRLNGFTHVYPGDVDMALVGPEGQALTFMSDLGGGVGVNGATITFSDSAVTGPPNALVSGTFKPSNVGVGDTFAVPGPVSYQSASPAGVATFASAFGGINPNGTWSLYVVDDTGFYSGSISGGWSLSVELNASSALPVTPTGPSPADDAGLASSPAVLDWADATGATSYDVLFDGRLHASVTTSQWTVNQSLAAGRHRWVIARNAIGSTQGPAWSFVVLATRIDGLACRVPTCTGTVTQIFIERVDQPDRWIARNEKTWIVVHGRGNSADTQEISDLAQAIATVRSGEQVLVLDWKNGAKYSGPLGELTDFTGEDWIKPVGTAAARMLEDYGFEGQHLFLIGHSWGSYVSDELAERMPFVRGANAPSRVGGLVALDPAKDVPNASSGGVYDLDQGSEIDFGAHSVCSWAFRSSSAGSVVTPSTAEESFKIDTQIGYAPASHGIVRTLFKTIIEDRLGSVSDASKYFQLDRLSPCQSGPWILNRFNEHGDRAEGGPYEGVIYAVGGVLSRVDFDGAMPTNFRVLSMTGNLVRLGWTLPASTAATTNIRLEGGLTRGQVLGTLTLPAAQESTVTLPSGSFFLRIRAVAGGVLSEPSDELVAQVNVPAAPSAPLSLLGLASWFDTGTRLDEQLLGRRAKLAGTGRDRLYRHVGAHQPE